MKALVLMEKGLPLTLHELPDPVPGEGEAIVQLHAAALNHRDVWIQKGQYAGLKYPIVPGSDGAGIVLSTGSQEDNIWIGKEVMINPAIGWGENQGHQHADHFRILGLPENGTFAEQVKIPVSSLVEKPAALSMEEAAALPLAGLTAYRALFKKADCRPGEKVLVTGIGGGVALFVLQFALAAGAEVYTSSGSREKIDKAMVLGAAGGASYTDPDWENALKKQAGFFDVIVDSAAGEGFGSLLQLAKPGGRLVVYGATNGNPPGIDMRRIFWKQLSVFGSTMGSPADFKEMTEFIVRHGIRPVIDKRFPFEQGEAALRHMNNALQFGKIILQIQ